VDRRLGSPWCAVDLRWMGMRFWSTITQHRQPSITWSALPHFHLAARPGQKPPPKCPDEPLDMKAVAHAVLPWPQSMISATALTVNFPCARKVWLERKGGQTHHLLEIRDRSPAGASPAQARPSQQPGSESCVAAG